jgi:hypothetical protein
MKTRTKTLLFLLALSGLAWAATETVDRVASVNPQHFLKGIYVGTAASRVVADTQNKVSHTGAGQIDYTFPALPDDGGTTGTACTISGWGTTVEGATVGDPCMVGFGYGASGVPIMGQDDAVNCYVSATNTVKVRRCGVRGAAALVDAGYAVRTFSFR